MAHSCFLCGRRKSEERLSFFHFPRKKEERERWISLCRPYVNFDILKVTQNTRICQRHFSPHSFHCKRERARLRHKAAPSIFFGKRVSYRKCVPLSECDDAIDDNGEMHHNHFLVNGILNDTKETEEMRSMYCNGASYFDSSDFENSLDRVTVDSSEILSVPASEFVEVQMEADSRLINENDVENIDFDNVNLEYADLENMDIENICILPDVGDENVDDDEAQSSDCYIDEPRSPDCVVISSDDESSDESSESESDDTVSVHNDHTYAMLSSDESSRSLFNGRQPTISPPRSIPDDRQPTISPPRSIPDDRQPTVSPPRSIPDDRQPTVSPPRSLPNNRQPTVSPPRSLPNSREPTVSPPRSLPNDRQSTVSPSRSLPNNREPAVSPPRSPPVDRQPPVSPERVNSAQMDVMRVSLVHYKNSTRILQDQLRAANKKLENLEHAIHELGLANKISKEDMETLLFRINPTN